MQVCYFLGCYSASWSAIARYVMRVVVAHACYVTLLVVLSIVDRKAIKLIAAWLDATMA